MMKTYQNSSLHLYSGSNDHVGHSNTVFGLISIRVISF